MSKRNFMIIIGCALLLLCWCFSPLFIAQCQAAETTSPQQNYISVPTAQWQTLKSNTQILDANLKLLADSLTLQEQQSAELMSLLREAKAELAKTQQALQSASLSLESAEKSLQTANEYTQKLKTQIEAEREAAAKERRTAYRKGWLNGFCTGAAAAAVAVLAR